MQCASAVNCRHLHDSFGIERQRTIFEIFASFAARSISSIKFRSLLLPAGPSVPSPAATPTERISGTGETPLAIIMLLERVVHAADTSLSEQLSIGLVDKDAMCRHNVRAKNSDAFQILHGRHSIRLQAVAAVASWSWSRLWKPKPAAFCSLSTVYGANYM